MTLTKSFKSCKFAPATKDEHEKSTSIVATTVGGGWKTTSFFIDSSGRSTFDLPLLLSFSSREDLDVFLAEKCINPPPENLVQDEEGKSTNNNDNNSTNEEESESSTISFEVKSYSVDETKDVVVEGLTVLASSIEDLTIRFHLEITVRASNHHYEQPRDSTSLVDPSDLSVVTNLEITPVLTTKKRNNQQDNGGIPDRMVLELAAIPDHMQRGPSTRIHETRLGSISLNLTLTHAFTIFVRSFKGPSIGNTLVSLTIRHSNSHPEPVTISNIAMHPGHSRDKTLSEKNRSMPGGQYSVTNMTKSVQWGYAPKTQLELPLKLGPSDAYSTILTVNASEEMQSRSFISPVSVTGFVGEMASTTTDSSNSAWLDKKKVIVAADAHWSTGLVAVEPTDAFRIDMNVQNSEVTLGEPMVLSLRIFNLGLEVCDLMLLMAKEDEDEESLKHRTVNTAVISEVDGYKFGVWGISGEDDGTVRLTRDYELLAIDAALMLGKVQSQHAVEAELRFVPLREGRLDVPNWKLYDRISGNWYTCIHNLKLVAKKSL